MVQILDAPVPQMGEQLPDILSFFDALVPVREQVIEVLKILPDDVPMRTAVRDTQLVEQLVEVPTDPVYVVLVLASKVYSRREIRGFLSGQGSTASGSRVVHNPVPQGRGGGGARGGLQGSLPVQNSAAVAEHIVDIPARRGLSDFLPGQGSTASSSSRLLDDADKGIQGFFRTFPSRKKRCEVGSALGVGTECGLYSVHAGSLCGLQMGRRCGTMRMGTRGGSRLLGGGTCLAVIVLCGGTLQGDMAVGAVHRQYGRPCDYAATCLGLSNSGSPSDSVHRAV